MKVKNWDGWEPEWLKLVDHYQKAGWRFSFASFEKMFPLDTLWVSWCPIADKAAAYAKEGEMLGL